MDLGATEIRIGRSMDCAIRTDDAMVSRHHARLYWAGQGYLLEDVALAAPVQARVMARHHGVVGADGTVHRPTDADLLSAQIEHPLDALRVSPENSCHG